MHIRIEDAVLLPCFQTGLDAFRPVLVVFSVYVAPIGHKWCENQMTKHIRREIFFGNVWWNFSFLPCSSSLVPPPLNFTGLSWTGPLWRRRHQNEFLGQVKFQGGLNLTTTVNSLRLFRICLSNIEIGTFFRALPERFFLEVRWGAWKRDGIWLPLKGKEM